MKFDELYKSLMVEAYPNIERNPNELPSPTKKSKHPRWDLSDGHGFKKWADPRPMFTGIGKWLKTIADDPSNIVYDFHDILQDPAGTIQGMKGAGRGEGGLPNLIAAMSPAAKFIPKIPKKPPVVKIDPPHHFFKKPLPSKKISKHPHLPKNLPTLSKGGRMHYKPGKGAYSSLKPGTTIDLGAPKHISRLQDVIKAAGDPQKLKKGAPAYPAGKKALEDWLLKNVPPPKNPNVNENRLLK